MKELESSRVKLQPDAILRAGMSGREAVETDSETYDRDPSRCYVAIQRRLHTSVHSQAYHCVILTMRLRSAEQPTSDAVQ